jgi:uridine phosphorylase
MCLLFASSILMGTSLIIFKPLVCCIVIQLGLASIRLSTFRYQDSEYGIIGRTVGSSFAVLVAEELFVSDCQLLNSIISAGQIVPLEQPPYVVLIERALRDEGISYLYLPPAPYSMLCPNIKEHVLAHWDHSRVPLYAGISWTTDAPFRETEEMIAFCRGRGILTVEMEVDALYAFAEAKQCNIVCFAHVTNRMGRIEGDFEKGEASGSHTALHIIRQAAYCWLQSRN